MKQIMLSIIAVAGLVGFTSLSYAEDMGKTSNDIKSEMKGQRDDMKVKPDDMNIKGEMKVQQDEMKTKSDHMKGEIKDQKDGMKSNQDMKGKTGEMGKNY